MEYQWLENIVLTYSWIAILASIICFLSYCLNREELEQKFANNSINEISYKKNIFLVMHLFFVIYLAVRGNIVTATIFSFCWLLWILIIKSLRESGKATNSSNTN